MDAMSFLDFGFLCFFLSIFLCFCDVCVFGCFEILLPYLWVHYGLVSFSSMDLGPGSPSHFDQPFCKASRNENHEDGI